MDAHRAKATQGVKPGVKRSAPDEEPGREETMDTEPVVDAGDQPSDEPGQASKSDGEAGDRRKRTHEEGLVPNSREVRLREELADQIRLPSEIRTERDRALERSGIRGAKRSVSMLARNRAMKTPCPHQSM